MTELNFAEMWKERQLESFDGEIWKPINKYEELYNISNYGRVYNIKKDIIVNQFIKYNENVCLLYKQGVRHQKVVKFLVVDSFIENINNYKRIKHINNNFRINTVNNLEWTNEFYERDYKYKGLVFNSRSKIYKVWGSMISRCEKLKDANYHKYGMFGVRVCNEWYDFEAFLKWAIENGYEENNKLSIDRIDSLGNYEPSNCRWTTYTIQNINKKQNPSKTGFIGVHKVRNKYVSTVSIDNKTVYIARTYDINEAILKRNEYILNNKLPHRLNL